MGNIFRFHKGKNMQNHRTTLILKNVGFSFIIKGWSAIVALLLVPITLKCLGNFNNGVWLTISSLLIWIDNMDIGLGNGLRNRLAENIAKGNEVRGREIVSSTFFMLIFIIVPTVIALTCIVYFTDIYSFLNVLPSQIPNLRGTIATAILLVGATFIFKIIGNFYFALQLPAISYFLVSFGQTLSLILTYIAYYTNEHSFLSIVVINTCAPLIVYLLAYPYTFIHKYPQYRPSLKYFNKGIVKDVTLLGFKFFFIQIASAVVFLSSNILISKLFTPMLVTPFQISYRYLNMLLTLFLIISTPLWSATTDAYQRKDYTWLNNTYKRMNYTLLIFFFILLAMVLCSNFIYKLWIGNMIVIPVSLTITTAIYVYEIIVSTNFSNFLNGMGILKYQMICTVFAAIAYIPLAYLFSRIHQDIISIVWVMIIINFPGLIANIFVFRKALQNKIQ